MAAKDNADSRKDNPGPSDHRQCLGRSPSTWNGQSVVGVRAHVIRNARSKVGEGGVEFCRVPHNGHDRWREAKSIASGKEVIVTDLNHHACNISENSAIRIIIQ